MNLKQLKQLLIKKDFLLQKSKHILQKIATQCIQTNNLQFTNIIYLYITAKHILYVFYCYAVYL